MIAYCNCVVEVGTDFVMCFWFREDTYEGKNKPTCSNVSAEQKKNGNGVHWTCQYLSIADLNNLYTKLCDNQNQRNIRENVRI